MFERVAGQQGWPKELWATQLAGLLSGEALDAFTADLACNYDAVKEVILLRSFSSGALTGTGESHKLHAAELAD